MTDRPVRLTLTYKPGYEWGSPISNTDRPMAYAPARKRTTSAPILRVSR
jgi:hypothetical protein